MTVNSSEQNKNSGFGYIVSTYALGVFNDNFFKQTALLLAVSAGETSLQGTATILFSLPFVLFSAHGGWLADRFSKRNVIIGAKVLELTAVLFGSFGLLTENWYAILAMVFTMGLQSTIFSPALNGSLPENFSKEKLNGVNAMVKLFTTIAILAGIGLSGFVLDQNWMPTNLPFGVILGAFVIIIVGIIGLLTSFRCSSLPAANPQVKFPWSGPFMSLLDFIQIRKKPLVFFSLTGSTFFYSISTIIVLLINTFGLQQLKLSQTITSILVVALMIGVCFGAILASKLSKAEKWIHLTVLSISMLAIGLLLTGLSVYFDRSLQLPIIFTALTTTGIGGGLFIIPITSYIQSAPADDEKGKIMGLCNFTDFSGIIIAGQVYLLLDYLFNPSTALIVLSIVGLLYALLIRKVATKFSTNN